MRPQKKSTQKVSGEKLLALLLRRYTPETFTGFPRQCLRCAWARMRRAITVVWAPRRGPRRDLSRRVDVGLCHGFRSSLSRGVFWHCFNPAP